MLNDEEVRHMAISLFTQESDRDRQVRVGASDLSNQCDRCLAAAMLGEKNRSAVTDRYWLGRVMGTAMGLLAEEQVKGRSDLEAEKHVWFGDIPGYGRVGGSIDLLSAADRHLFDWKGTKRADIAILEDFLQARGLWRVGLAPRWELQARGGYKFKIDSKTVMTISAREHDEKMRKMEYKFSGYYGQLNLYCHSGVADTASVIFFARDGNGMYDNPGLDYYLDPSRKHDIFVWSFDYDRDYAEALLRRAGDIWAGLQAGAPSASFDPHELCFVCDMEREIVDIPAVVYVPSGSVAA